MLTRVSTTMPLVEQVEAAVKLDLDGLKPIALAVGQAGPPQVCRQP